MKSNETTPDLLEPFDKTYTIPPGNLKTENIYLDRGQGKGVNEVNPNVYKYWEDMLKSKFRNSPLPVITKKDFVKRYAAGEFGNASPTWNTLDEFLASGYQGLVHIRNRVAGAYTIYNVQAEDVVRESEYASSFVSISKGGHIARVNQYFSGMAPTAKTLIQGEVMLDERGWYFYYSRVAKPMRDALREEAREARGITAVSLLKHFLCPNSWEWLNVLLDRYPGHVVELSAYGEKWGTLAPRYNTCFWEVRRY